MKIVGCDFHPGHQQVAVMDTVTGEVQERKLKHGTAEAEQFYRELEVPALVGMESVGNTLWFEQWMERLGHELWIGDAAQIRASYVRRQKTDRRDASHILKLLLEQRFPRIWVPNPQQRDQRQLLVHRHRLVQMRSRIKNELQHLALNQGVQKKRQLWNRGGRTELERLPLQGWTARRREDLLGLLETLEARVATLDDAVSQAALHDPQACLLMTQPGVGPITSLAFVLTLGDVSRFQRGKQVASYLGLIPSEHSSGSKRRLGAISKQGNVFLRTMLVEAAQSAVRHDKEFGKQYRSRCHHKPTGVAKVAAAHKLAVRLYWMLRTQTPYPQIVHNEGSPSHPVAGVR